MYNIFLLALLSLTDKTLIHLSHVKNSPQKIGLSEKDSEVYLACLELEQPASVIARDRFKASYNIFDFRGTVKKGLVSIHGIKR